MHRQCDGNVLQRARAECIPWQAVATWRRRGEECLPWSWQRVAAPRVSGQQPDQADSVHWSAQRGWLIVYMLLGDIRGLLRGWGQPHCCLRRRTAATAATRQCRLSFCPSHSTSIRVYTRVLRDSTTREGRGVSQQAPAITQAGCASPAPVPTAIVLPECSVGDRERRAPASV